MSTEAGRAGEMADAGPPRITARVVDTLNDFAFQHSNHRRIGDQPWQECDPCREVAGYAIEAIEHALLDRVPPGHVLLPVTIDNDPRLSALVPIPVTQSEQDALMAKATRILLNGGPQWR